jgi:23S rRNA pseudouridine1911/1915/1917 synthase
LKVQRIFEDDHVIVVDKPAGLLTVATATERRRTLHSILSELIRRKLFIVHRLDREASGLVVFAKTTHAKEHLQAQFKDHTAGRTYIAVVEKRVTPESFTIRSPLAENTAHRVYPSATGKPAVTHVKVLQHRAKASLIEVRLETGRKHQIRVHLAEKGYPIVGDKFYGGRASSIHRLALHAARLEFRHPATGKVVRLESRYPKTFDVL